MLFDIFKIDEFKATISSQKQQLEMQEKQIQELKEFILQRQPLFDFDTLHEDDLADIWNNQWGFINHNSEKQLIRQERARQAVLTPLSLDKEHGTGTFHGTDDTYETSLVSCQCEDFQKRFLPCKHMYRLAYELDCFLLNEPVFSVPYPRKLMWNRDYQAYKTSFSRETLDLLSELRHNNIVTANANDARILLNRGIAVVSSNKYELLRQYTKDELFALLPPDTPLKKSMRKTDLITGIIENHPKSIEKLEKKLVVIELSPYARHLVGGKLYDSFVQ